MQDQAETIVMNVRLEECSSSESFDFDQDNIFDVGNAKIDEEKLDNTYKEVQKAKMNKAFKSLFKKAIIDPKTVDQSKKSKSLTMPA